MDSYKTRCLSWVGTVKAIKEKKSPWKAINVTKKSTRSFSIIYVTAVSVDVDSVWASYFHTIYVNAMPFLRSSLCLALLNHLTIHSLFPAAFSLLPTSSRPHLCIIVSHFVSYQHRQLWILAFFFLKIKTHTFLPILPVIV